jgi:hypothetical protein
VTDKPPLSLMQWIRENLTEPPKCDECEGQVRTEDDAGGALHLFRQHLHTCSAHKGLERVVIAPGDLPGTHG